jgi:CheY-like chemotaxis protein
MNDIPKLIYFIDDDSDDLLLMEEIAASLGHNSRSFHSGTHLTEAIIKGLPVPDMFFLDVMMPMIDGFEVLSDLKANPAYAAVPVIIHSTECDEKCVSKCFELGASYFLNKACSMRGIKASLNHVFTKDWATFKKDRKDFLFEY